MTNVKKNRYPDAEGLFTLCSSWTCRLRLSNLEKLRPQMVPLSRTHRHVFLSLDRLPPLLTSPPPAATSPLLLPAAAAVVVTMLPDEVRTCTIRPCSGPPLPPPPTLSGDEARLEMTWLMSLEVAAVGDERMASVLMGLLVAVVVVVDEEVKRAELLLLLGPPPSEVTVRILVDPPGEVTS